MKLENADKLLIVNEMLVKKYLLSETRKLIPKIIIADIRWQFHDAFDGILTIRDKEPPVGLETSTEESNTWAFSSGKANDDQEIFNEQCCVVRPIWIVFRND